MPTNNQNDPQQLIDQFVTETVDKAGFGDLPQEFQEKYKEKLEITLYKKIGVVLNNMLTDQDVEELSKFVEANPNPTNEELYKFYASKIENLPEKIADAMKDFQHDFLNTALKVQGNLGLI